jgi:hypothetical protein
VNSELSTACQEATTQADEAADKVENCTFRCRSGLGCTEWLGKDFDKCEAECEPLLAEAEAAASERSNACDADLKAAAKTCRALSPVATECSLGCSDASLGNGSCDTACAVPDCDFDEGDCGDPAGACAPGCMPVWLGDGQCHEECEVSECKYDDGDCPNWDECPVNSGYPCVCDLSRSRCDDGTYCGKFRNGGSYGLCMKACENPGETSDCDISPRWGWIVSGTPACIFGVDGNAAKGSYCGFICRFYDAPIRSYCPPGTDCKERTVGEGPNDIIGFCEP